MPEDPRPLRIALVAPPMLSVPPSGYAGTERVIGALADELTRRGHAVTLFAPGDSQVDCELVPTVPRSLWSMPEAREKPSPYDDNEPFFALTVARAWQEHERFDVIHSHLEAYGLVFARYCPTPVVTTLHGRLDVPGLPELLLAVPEIPLVSVSDNQRRWFPELNWLATVHHGLPLASVTYSERPGAYLALVGRLSPEKGIGEGVELARATGMQLRVAAKMRHASERQLFHDVLEPAIQEGVAEYLGEVGPVERDALYAGAFATLMLGGWPEPFGLVAIESLAAGTPVIARRAGALPEIIEHGVDGLLVDDVTEAVLAATRIASLDRRAIRERALARFSPSVMAERYERVYALAIQAAAGRRETRMPATAAAAPVGPVAERRAEADMHPADRAAAGRPSEQLAVLGAPALARSRNPGMTPVGIGRPYGDPGSGSLAANAGNGHARGDAGLSGAADSRDERQERPLDELQGNHSREARGDRPF